ncbi:MAG: OmpW/AlkL family protein [Rhodomicrobium sp.]
MKHFLKAIALAGLLAATGAQAADIGAPGGYKDEVIVPTWWDAGDIFVRVRAEAFVPNIGTRNWNFDGPLPGADLTATTTFIPELDLSYFVTKNIAFELICCVGRTQVNAAGSLPGLGYAGTVGDTWFFPPTVMSQYHFDATPYGFPGLKPYVGLGGGYIWFFDEGNSNYIFKNLKLNSTATAAAQVGFDYHLAGNWFWNVDFKYLWAGTDFSTIHGAVTGHVDIDPIIVGTGIGYRFGGYVPLK